MRAAADLESAKLDVVVESGTVVEQLALRALIAYFLVLGR